MNIPVRSLLFVPGDSERKLEKSRASQADALVLDLEDSVSASRKRIARGMVATALRSELFSRATPLWVRINPLSTPDALQDLVAVVAGRPAGILLPKADGPAAVQSASLYLDALEVREGLAVGSTRILPIVTETARAAFAIGDYAQANLPRLYGLTWGAEDLSVDVGATRNTDEDGRLSLTYRLVRSLTLLAAKSCGVQAIDAVYPDYTNLDGLRIDCSASRKEGFTGRFAIHPDQVEVINTAFSPSKDDIDYALEVVAAFEASPGAGTVGLNGKMLDKPHLIQAQKVLALRDALAFRK